MGFKEVDTYLVASLPNRLFKMISGKTMRTLVADQDFQQRRFVERSLTALGYFRTTTANCLDELITLTHYSPSLFERFDLLIVNSNVFSSREISWFDFCVGNSRLKHVLIADSNMGPSKFENWSERSDQQVWRVHDINTDVLIRLIALIDSRCSVSVG